MKVLAASFLLILVTVPAGSQQCRILRGRAVEYRGDGFFAIWHVGTHHEFFPADKDSVDLVCRYFDCDSGDRQPALFADFTICPTAKFVVGAAQAAIVKKVDHPRVVAEWPPARNAREFVTDFLEWYLPGTSATGSDKLARMQLMRWDLTPKLFALLTDDYSAQAKCADIIGLDFDPILNAQDPSDKYEVRSVQRAGDVLRVRIYRAEAQKDALPDVIAEIRHSQDRWQFSNFRYPAEKNDLLTILKRPRPVCKAPLLP